MQHITFTVPQLTKDARSPETSELTRLDRSAKSESSIPTQLYILWHLQ